MRPIHSYQHVSYSYPISALIILTLTFAWVIPAAAQSAVAVESIDHFIEEQMAAQRIPGLALAIIKEDEIIHLQGYGEGITPQTQFFIASLSKSFTALAVMQLVESGQIDLDATVQTYLPAFTHADPDAASQITIRHLLNQTSGLADAGFPESKLPQPTSIAERVDTLRTAVPVSEPGTTFHYFNPNYALLAQIVEVVSGQTFDNYLQNHIFEPLEMSHTFSAVTSDEAVIGSTQLAPGHLHLYGLPVRVSEMSGYLGGSGGLIATAEDLAHYLMVQNNGGDFEGRRLISPDSLTVMHTPPQAIDSNYAMGWLTTEYNGMTMLEHSGLLSAYYADMILLPETGHGLVLLYNINSMPAALLAFPQVKAGLINIITGSQPPVNSFTVQTYSLIISLIVLLSVLLALRSLTHLSQWPQRQGQTAFIRLLPGLVWKFTPLIILLLLPPLTAFSGRVFSSGQLFRFMPDIYLWLGTVGILGSINGLARLYLYKRVPPIKRRTQNNQQTDN